MFQWLSGTQHITFRKIVFQLWSDAIIILNYEKFIEREAYPKQKFEQNEIDLVLLGHRESKSYISCT